MDESQENTKQREENLSTAHDTNHQGTCDLDEPQAMPATIRESEKDTRRKKRIKRISLVVILVLFCGVYFGLPWFGSWNFEKAISFVPFYIFFGYLIIFNEIFGYCAIFSEIFGVDKPSDKIAETIGMIFTGIFLLTLVISIVFSYMTNRWFLFIILMLLLLAFPYVGCVIGWRSFNSEF